MCVSFLHVCESLGLFDGVVLGVWEGISWCVMECDCETGGEWWGGVRVCPQHLCCLGDGHV